MITLPVTGGRAHIPADRFSPGLRALAEEHRRACRHQQVTESRIVDALVWLVALVCLAVAAWRSRR